MKNKKTDHTTLIWEKKNIFADKYLFHDGKKGIASVQFNSMSFKYRNAHISFHDDTAIQLVSRNTFKTSIDIIKDGASIGRFSKSGMSRFTLEVEGETYNLVKKTWVSEWTWYNAKNERILFLNKEIFGEKGNIVLKGDLNFSKSLMALLGIYAISLEQKESMATLFVVFLPLWLSMMS
ncbi:hypothetical protein C900_04832 [Fulvivirga imtechensis AK7]|uniref:Uncharacterized protein n=1 Tax=Fulvivirga imtechensis AK7 TaxID=1237149 RepID=L8JQF6_9BACT|nr:hypothetical protein [Fulvivirga imtechensis]ELR69607.1 hypothetical protein C900_04832 [Fulvivirga imtechensis AK7]